MKALGYITRGVEDRERELDHLSTNCPRKKKLYNTRSMFLECTNEELVEIDEEISYTETIYSICKTREISISEIRAKS